MPRGVNLPRSGLVQVGFPEKCHHRAPVRNPLLRKRRLPTGTLYSARVRNYRALGGVEDLMHPRLTIFVLAAFALAEGQTAPQPNSQQPGPHLATVSETHNISFNVLGKHFEISIDERLVSAKPELVPAPRETAASERRESNPHLREGRPKVR